MDKKKANKRLRRAIRLFIFSVFLFCIFVLAYKFDGIKIAKEIYEKYFVESQEVIEPIVVEPEIDKTINIYNGYNRPIAVMIDNNVNAWPQAGLNSAYLIYEIIVEGGETRLMACFKGQDLELIGPIRSSRHYFIDYAMENDAIYVHYGWSPQAQNDISDYGVNNINGITESSSSFWRSKEKYAPHNAVTDTSEILKIADRKGYRTQSKYEPETESVLNYTYEEVNLDAENSFVANEITIPYSYSHKVYYSYDSESKMYTRYARNKVQHDWITGEEVTVKNIIITKAENYTLTDAENKGRQGLNNIGTLDGYYITNGKAIPIKCEKEARELKTVYYDLDGNEINVNDGRTFIQICPINADISFVEGE